MLSRVTEEMKWKRPVYCTNLLKCVQTVRGVDLLEHKLWIRSLAHLRHFALNCEPGAESGVDWIKLAHDRAQ